MPTTPPPTPILGAGVKLGYQPADGTGTVTWLAEVVDLTPGEESVSKVEVTNHDTSTRRIQNIAGFIEVGDTTADLMYNTADAGTIRTILEARANKQWTIRFPDGITSSATGSTLVFVGFLTKAGHTVPLKTQMLTKVEICAADGTVVFTPAT